MNASSHEKPATVVNTMKDGLGRRLDSAVAEGAVTLVALAVSVMQAVSHVRYEVFNVWDGFHGEQPENERLGGQMFVIVRRISSRG
jgi:hypothetical protein